MGLTEYYAPHLVCLSHGHIFIMWWHAVSDCTVQQRQRDGGRGEWGTFYHNKETMDQSSSEDSTLAYIMGQKAF